MARVFSTTSSSISLPENMKAAKGMGVPEKVSFLALPLGVIFCGSSPSSMRGCKLLKPIRLPSLGAFIVLVGDDGLEPPTLSL